MRMMTWREMLWFAIALAVSAAASGAFAATAVASPSSLLDLQWLVIGGAAGLTMFGGVVGTLFAVHAAQEAGKTLKVPLLLALNICIAVVLGLPAYAAQVMNGWRPEILLALPLLGAAGPFVFAPAVKSISGGVIRFIDRIIGKAAE